jgi:hypothetical protein
MSALTQKRVILKVWYQNGIVHDNIAEINAHTNTNTWRVACSERLLSGPGKGACYILFVLELQPPIQTEQRLVVSVAPDANGVIRDNMAIVNAYVRDGWSVACSERLLDDPGNSLSYVLYLLTKPAAAAPAAAAATPSP